MEIMDVCPAAGIGDLTTWSDELAAQPRYAAAGALVREVVALYGQTARSRCEPGEEDRDRIRVAAGRAAADLAERDLVDLLRRLTREAAANAPESPVLAGTSRLVLADCLVAAGFPHSSSTDLLLDGLDPEHGFAKGGTVLVFRLDAARTEAVRKLAEINGNTPDGQLVLAGAHAENGVLLIPGDAQRILDHLQSRLGRKVHCAASSRVTEGFADAYREARTVLGLALAAGREAGLYSVDDFLTEYAAVRDPKVAGRLTAIVHPLLGHEHLYETLRAFVRCGHDRVRAARELFVHPATVDDRNRRIAEITGYDPTTWRSGQVLSVAVTLFVLRSSRS